MRSTGWIALVLIGGCSNQDGIDVDVPPDARADAAPWVDPRPDAMPRDAGPTCTPSPAPLDEPPGPCTLVATTYMNTEQPRDETTTWWYAADGLELHKAFDFSEFDNLTSFYDDARRLVRKRRRDLEPGTESWIYTYDDAGRRDVTHYFSSGEPWADITYYYDDQGRLERDVLTRVGFTEPIDIHEYSYDAAGHLEWVTRDEAYVDGVPEDSRHDEYEGDRLVHRTWWHGAPPDVTASPEEAHHYVYDDAGRLSRVEIDVWWPDGIIDLEDRYTYDEEDRVVQVDHWNIKIDEELQRDVYTYGPQCMSACLEQ